jgi:hypothetical protein
MTETLIDPGDGSGTYAPVSGEYFLEFFTNGTVDSNYMLCTLSGTNTGSYTSTYFAEEQYIQSQTCNANQDFSNLFSNGRRKPDFKLSLRRSLLGEIYQN